MQASLQRGAALAAAMREMIERLLRELACRETAAQPRVNASLGLSLGQSLFSLIRDHGWGRPQVRDLVTSRDGASRR